MNIICIILTILALSSCSDRDDNSKINTDSKNEDEIKILHELEKKSESGDIDSTFNLAKMYADENGYKKDKNKALDIYRKLSAYISSSKDISCDKKFASSTLLTQYSAYDLYSPDLSPPTKGEYEKTDEYAKRIDDFVLQEENKSDLSVLAEMENPFVRYEYILDSYNLSYDADHEIMTIENIIFPIKKDKINRSVRFKIDKTDITEGEGNYQLGAESITTHQTSFNVSGIMFDTIIKNELISKKYSFGMPIDVAKNAGKAIKLIFIGRLKKPYKFSDGESTFDAYTMTENIHSYKYVIMNVDCVWISYNLNDKDIVIKKLSEVQDRKI
jgi:hypothetical protein